MVRRDILEFAVLGILSDGPVHGYELRKRLTDMLGPFRSLSYGTLYPTLRRLVNGERDAELLAKGMGALGRQLLLDILNELGRGNLH